MTTIDKVRNVPTIVLAGQGLKDVAHTAEGVDDAGKVFSLISYGLQALGVKVQAADPRADLTLNNQLAAATRSLSDLKTKQPGSDVSTDPMGTDAVGNALRTAAALDSLSDGVIRAARSIRVGCGCGDTTSDSQSISLIQDFKADARDVAFQARTLADLIMDGVGLNFRDPDSLSDILSADDCGCARDASQAAGRLPDLSNIDLENLRSATLVDHKQLQASLAMVDALAPRVTTFLGSTGDVLCDAPVEVGFCDDKCTPVGSLIGLAFGMATAPLNAGGTAFIPTFTVDWDLCCKCSCYYISSQKRSETVTTTHTATPTIPSTRPKGAALNVANSIGKREVKKFQASVAPPPPAPPAYVAAGIAPALAVPVCPKC